MKPHDHHSSFGEGQHACPEQRRRTADRSSASSWEGRHPADRSFADHGGQHARPPKRWKPLFAILTLAAAIALACWYVWDHSVSTSWEGRHVADRSCRAPEFVGVPASPDKVSDKDAPGSTPDTLLLTSRNADMRARVDALASLGRDIPEPDRQALYRFLLDPDRVDNLTPVQRHLLVNNIMAKLRIQHDGCPDLGSVLIGVHENEAMDPTDRDYALQHLGIWYEGKAPLDDADYCFWNILENPENESFGTAALAVHHLMKTRPDYSAARLGEAALQRVKHTAATDKPDTTAIWLCAELGMREALEHILPLLTADRAAHRMMATTAVRALAGKEDLPALEHLMETAPEFARASIEKTISKIQQKENQGA